MPLPSASMKKRSEEVGLGLTSDDSAYHHGVSGDYHPNNNTAIPLPMIPNGNVNETSQFFSKEIGGPAGVTSMTDSSQFKSAQNFQMDHYYPYQGQGQEPKPLPCIPDSGFSFPQGYTGWPYQHTRHEHDSQIIPTDVMNAAFNLNSFENLPNGGKCVTPSYSSAGQPQMVNHGGTAMSHIMGQPLQSMNFGMAMSNPNQGGAESLLNSGKLDERFMTLSSGNNRDSKPSTIIPTPKINMTGNSERTCLPPINTYHSQPGSRSILNPGLDMNSVNTGFPNNNEVISSFSGTGSQDVLFDSRPALYLGPSYAFQKPAAGDQNHYLRPGFERCMALPSSPYVGSQHMAYDNGPSRVNRQLVPYSNGTVATQSPSMLLPGNSGKLSSPPFATPPAAVASGSTRGQDSSTGYHGKTQVVGSLQQSNSPIGQESIPNLGRQHGKGIMTAQPSAVASLKRAASQPLSSTVQDQRRKTLSTHPFIRPSFPTCARVAPSGPNTCQAIPALVHGAQSLTPQAIDSFVPQMFHSNWSKSALSAPNTTQSQITPPVMQRAPLLQPRVSSLQPSSHISSPQNQQLIAQALALQRLSAPSIIPHIKYKDETPEPIGHKCFLCKRDLSYSPEGPISKPLALPAAAVLPCGHTFHAYCLERITPDGQSKDPPCIPCALCE